jgi:hypothetical protein
MDSEGNVLNLIEVAYGDCLEEMRSSANEMEAS